MTMTPDPALQAWLDPEDRRTADIIRTSGTYIQYAFAANRFDQRPDEFSVPLLQLTYDDRDGRFPDEDGYADASWIQPRPGEFSAR
ncbi:hypothetical protein FVP74_05180 [Microbacterium saccharophilum]|uniref:Uncharacterized protein n=1 Tax=Microbacterium saccharophilum TaxID=1213358 RepID=A0A5C8I6Z7_9MICO|nr:hypothetical protein [Microbacterium saccharophilum]TXK13990.1 hypothetical protein FVP74_05180 [Microbacterium saccharophilum]GEP46529.1 hypothetical protein MSA03_00370 [Microbacterium saccharophilum]